MNAIVAVQQQRPENHDTDEEQCPDGDQYRNQRSSTFGLAVLVTETG